MAGVCGHMRRASLLRVLSRVNPTGRAPLTEGWDDTLNVRRRTFLTPEICTKMSLEDFIKSQRVTVPPLRRLHMHFYHNIPNEWYVSWAGTDCRYWRGLKFIP